MFDEKNKEAHDVLKPSGAIQIVLTDNKKLSLTQRKAWNVLILNAHSELDSEETFKIDLMTICNILGNNDIFNLKRDLLKLMSTTVQFNYLQSRDKSVWEASTLLADAKIDDGGLSYSFGPLMRHKLNNLELYARINLSIQKNIDSKYSLILYEIAKDHYIAAQGRGLTPFIEVDDLKRLLECQNEKSYNRFAEFNRVIKKALKEINEKTDITVKAVYKKKGKTIVAIQFQVKPKTDKSSMLEGILQSKQGELPIAGNDLYNTLVNQFRMDPKRAVEIIRDYEESVIRDNIVYTAQQMAKGKITENVPGFLYKAITENYQKSDKPGVVSVLPKIEPGMKIDNGKGKTFIVSENNVLRNSKNHIFATENEIRLRLAASEYKIVSGEDTVPDAIDVEFVSGVPNDVPVIKAGMKIDFSGITFVVSEDKTVKNIHNYTIFSEKQLQDHIMAGACHIIE